MLPGILKVCNFLQAVQIIGKISLYFQGTTLGPENLICA